jgi:hypothetical protein
MLGQKGGTLVDTSKMTAVLSWFQQSETGSCKCIPESLFKTGSHSKSIKFSASHKVESNL